MVLFLILSCIPRGDPGGQANFENHEKPFVFSMNLLGWPFCAKCKEHKFQSTGARKLKEKQTKKQRPRRADNMLQKSSILAPKMPPKSFGNRSRRLPEGQRTRTRRQEPAKRGQERAKSAPRAPGSDFLEFPGPGGGPKFDPPGVARQTWGSSFGGVGPLKHSFRVEGVSFFLFFRGPRKNGLP